MLSINYCPFCGSGLREGYKFCKNCGADLSKKAKPVEFIGSLWRGVRIGLFVIIGLGIVGYIVGKPGLIFSGLLFVPFIAGFYAGKPGTGAWAALLLHILFIVLFLITIEISTFLEFIGVFVLFISLIFFTPFSMIIGAIGGKIGKRYFQKKS